MTARDDKRDATRARLIDVAREAFRRDGYERTTFRSMAQEANVSTGSFFSAWKSKEALFLEATGHDPDLSAALSKVAVTCAGYPGALGDLSEDIVSLRKWYFGNGVPHAE